LRGSDIGHGRRVLHHWQAPPPKSLPRRDLDSWGQTPGLLPSDSPCGVIAAALQPAGRTKPPRIFGFWQCGLDL